MTPPTTAPPALLSVDRLSLRTKRGPVFTDVSLELAAGAVGVVVGPSGSGRSSLLLASTGRMRGLTGSGRFGHQDLVRDAAAVRRRTAVARVSDLVDVEPQLTVGESLVERSLIDEISAASAEAAFAAVEDLLDCPFPRRGLVDDLSRLDRGRLALALAALRPSELIIFDDVDRDLDPVDQNHLYAALTAVADTGPAVLASSTTHETVPRAATVVALTPRTTARQEI